METGEGDNNPFAPKTPPVMSEPEVRGGGGGGGGAEGGGGGVVASIGSDNPFAAALTSISLNGGGGGNVPSVSSSTPPPPETSTTTTTTPDAAAAVVASSSTGGIASKLTGFVDSLGKWASADGKDDDHQKPQVPTSQPFDYPFEDGILGEGLAEYGGGGDHHHRGGRLFHPGDALSQAEASASARERELERREARIRQQEELLEAEMAGFKRKNWPWFKPILYHDINAEVPAVNRGMVRAAYTAWLLTVLAYVLNWFTLTLQFFGAAGAGFTDFFMASVFMLSGVPISWMFWYKGGLYSVSQRTQPGLLLSAAYFRFFINFGFHLLMTAWMIVGLPMVGTGCAGVFSMFSLFTAAGFFFVGPTTPLDSFIYPPNVKRLNRDCAHVTYIRWVIGGESGESGERRL